MAFVKIDEAINNYQKKQVPSYIKARTQLLAWDLAVGLKDKKNFGWYLRIAKKYDEGILRELLSKVKNQKDIRNKGAYFISLLLKIKK